MNGPPKNIEHSVKQRLVNRSRERGEVFNNLLIRFAIERFLYRLTQSPHASRFVLKGAMLFAIWMDRPYRPTQDVDLLGTGNPDIDELRHVFAEICMVNVEPDGLQFESTSITVNEIREEQVYAGIRVKLQARLGKARIPVQIDIGFGDVITPAPAQLVFGPLLDFPPPRLPTYPPETVVAEKLEAMVALGMANSRMKDFCDLWMMSQTMRFEGAILADAIRATFSRRRTDMPDETFTPAYKAVLYQTTGKVNADAFRGFQPGEVLFLGAQFRRIANNLWEVKYHFQASPNKNDLAIGSISGISKKGWEYLWVQYDDDVDGTAHVMIRKPRAVYVEQVYETAEFAALGINPV